MRVRLGIAIASDAVHGVAVRAGRVVWHAHEMIQSGERVVTTVERLVDAMPATLARRSAVRVAFGPAYSHVKRIDGLPPSRQQRVVERIVRENADSFFPRLGGRTLIAGVERRGDGSIWAAALDGALAADVIRALARKRLLLASAMPAVAPVARAARPGNWSLSDKEVRLDVSTMEGGVITACRRCASPAGSDAAPPVVAALASLGADASDLTVAYATATVPPGASFVWTPPPDARRVRALDRARVAAATLLLIASATGALVARGVHAARVTAAATATLAMLRDTEIAGARVEAELRRATAELERIHQFAAARGRMTQLVGALSESLPDSTAVVSLRIDSLEASFAALAPSAAAVVPALMHVTGVASPRIVGSVTREMQGAARVERATFRLRRLVRDSPRVVR